MTSETAALPNGRERGAVPGRSPRKRRALLAAAALATAGVLAASCGGGTSDPAAPAQETGIAVAVPEDVAEANAAVLASRPGEGITAAAGTVQAGEPCAAPGSPGSGETVKIALVTPDVFDLEIIGLGNLVFDDPKHIIDAYVNKVNSFGGISGRCFEFHGHEYGFTDPAGDYGRICAEVPQQEPLVLLVIGADDTTLQCATLGAGIPSIGLYAQFSEDTFAATGGLLRVDHGSVEYLLANSMEAAASAGVLTTDDRVVLLHQAVEVDEGAATDDAQAPGEHGHVFGSHVHTADIPGVATFNATSERLALDVVGWVGVQLDFSGTAVLVVEQQFRNLGGEIFDPDQASFDQAAAAMPPEFARLLAGMRQYFITTATEMRQAGVTAVVAAGDWADVRNFMRAADLVEWYPTWIINDAQYALLVLTDSPDAQGLNLVQVSSRRAADDPIDGLDRGCLSLRNTETMADPFTFQFHTDAWSLMTSTCDYLDIVFGAISRVDGPLTRESFVAALSETDYEAAHGATMRFAADDLYGSDSFRVLSADPYCVLNDWGCMRPVSGWLQPVAHAGADHAGEDHGAEDDGVEGDGSEDHGAEDDGAEEHEAEDDGAEEHEAEDGHEG